MRRLLAIAFLAALPAAAQVHGVPASVTSITPSRSNPGVPASVTSLGPNGYVDPMFRRPPVDPMFRNPAFGNRCCDASRSGYGRHPGVGHHRRNDRRFYPAYYPYYGYPVVYAAPASGDEEYAEEEPSDSSRDDQRYGEHDTDYREAQRLRQEEEDRQAQARRREEEAQQADARAAAPAQPKPEKQDPAAVLVFKDGHRQDVSGYAITGDVLYDLGQGGARKIQLADLDLPATRKLNDQLGNDFRLPVRPAK